MLPSPRSYYLALREGPMTGATIKRNILYSSGKECVFLDELQPKREGKTEDRRGRELAHARDADTDFNIYYSAANSELGTTMLDKQQRDGVDKNSQAVDPLFVDPENGDFRFKSNSPALKMGIVPIDLTKIGLQETPSDRSSN